MNDFQIPVVKDAYLFYNGELKHVEVNYFEYYHDKISVIYNEDMCCSLDYFEDNAYRTKEDFNNGIPINDVKTCSNYRMIYIRIALRNIVYGMGQMSKDLKIQQYHNGEFISSPIEDCVIRMSLDENNRIKYSTSPGVAYYYDNFAIKKYFGVTTDNCKVPSVKEMIELNDSQKQIIENLHKAIDDCKKNNIELFFDYDSMEVYAANKKNIEDITVYSDGDEELKDNDIIILNDIMHLIDSNINYISEGHLATIRYNIDKFEKKYNKSEK